MPLIRTKMHYQACKMRVKKLFLLLIIVLIAVSTVPLSFAQSETDPTEADVNQALESYKAAELLQIKIARLKIFGTRALQIRIRIMERWQLRIRASVIDEDMKDILLADLQANIDGLKNLKAKIEGDTDLETLKEDVRSIFTDYRIFLVVLPRNHARFAGSRLNTIINHRLEKLDERLDTIVSRFQEQGKDTATLESLIELYENQVSLAQAKIAEADAKFVLMSPSDVETAREYLSQGREYLDECRTGILSAKETLRQIAAEIKRLRQSSD